VFSVRYELGFFLPPPRIEHRFLTPSPHILAAILSEISCLQQNERIWLKSNKLFWAAFCPCSLYRFFTWSLKCISEGINSISVVKFNTNFHFGTFQVSKLALSTGLLDGSSSRDEVWHNAHRV